MIGKGLRKRWSSFLEGRVVLMFCASSQMVSPTLNGGIGKRHDVEWTSILFKGTRYLVAKIQMELFEICRNLMSSIQHNRFKGHFEFRIKALVSEERGHHGRRVRCVVVCKLGQGKEVDPIVLLVVDVHPKVLLQDLVDPFVWPSVSG